MTGKKHIATYPLFGTHLMTGIVNTRNRIGTGYIYTTDEIPKIREHLRRYGHPLRLRWRNDECWRQALVSDPRNATAYDV